MNLPAACWKEPRSCRRGIIVTAISEGPVWFIALAFAVLAGAAVYDVIKRRADKQRQEQQDGSDQT